MGVRYKPVVGYGIKLTTEQMRSIAGVDDPDACREDLADLICPKRGPIMWAEMGNLWTGPEPETVFGWFPEDGDRLECPPETLASINALAALAGKEPCWHVGLLIS